MDSHRRLHRTPPMPAGELAALRTQLVEERERLARQYRSEVQAAQAIREEGTEDLEEQAELDVERDQLFSYSEQDRDRLRLIEEAIQRLDSGTYGLCLASGLPIPIERLRALPWAQYRAEVQEVLEGQEVAQRIEASHRKLDLRPADDLAIRYAELAER